ncbi:MAG: hypothetical protein ACKOZY_12855, partial [Flavobacteriales bacterium]
MRYILSIMFTACFHVILGQVKDFEEYKRQRERDMKQFGDDYKRGLDSLRSARDNAFTRMLEGNWTREELFETPMVDATPKPEVPPVFVPSEKEPDVNPTIIHAEPSPEEPLDSPDETPVEKTEAPEVAPSTPEPIKEDETLSPALRTERRYGSKFTMRRDTLFGNEWMLPVISGKWPVLNGDPNPSSISAYWKDCSEREYEDLLACIQFQRSAYGLSDWGTYQMLQKLAAWNFKRDHDRLLFQW